MPQLHAVWLFCEYISSFVEKDFAHKLPKMDFQDQVSIAINVGNISPTVFRKKKINNSKFLGKKKVAAKVLLTMVAKVHALYCSQRTS